MKDAWKEVLMVFILIVSIVGLSILFHNARSNQRNKDIEASLVEFLKDYKCEKCGNRFINIGEKE